MSKLRPECGDAAPGSPCPTNGTALLIILKSVECRAGLIHGKLDGPGGQHCAIGSYFADHPEAALKSTLIDEVALVNDSVPDATPRQRKLHVLRWLRWRLAEFDMPGFRRRPRT